ncbi:DUF6734 family protein [Aquimarina latercula]|uniref:DUF6734 family protein n=1 Tax=Aquimarina latercula TaxID=987 RepID=UPI000483D8BC|nr:DUF6734 family protein [Aquimarina latercula]
MKIIQSFWTKPTYHNSDDANARFNGGWPNQKYAFYSFALSALTINRFYRSNELFTDKRGKELFDEMLELPYSDIYTSLEKINNYHPKLWAFGKLVTCAEQSEPFIHLDNDIFIWDKIPYDINHYDIIAQNIETNFPGYAKTFKYMLANFDFIPNELISNYYKNGKILAHNAGFIGGKNNDYFKQLYTTAKSLIEKNQHHFPQIDVGIFNTIFEQQLGYAITEKDKLKVQYLFENVQPNFAEIIDLSTVPLISKFIHCIGFAKKSIFACEQIEARLQYHFPEYYKNIKAKLHKLFPDQGFDIEIKPSRLQNIFDFYDFVENITIEKLLTTKFVLKKECIIDFNTDPITIQFTIPYNGKVDKKDLVGWHSILLYFMEPVSVQELYDELSEDEDFLKQFGENIANFKTKMISFVLEKTLLLEILQPEEIKVPQPT